MRELEWLGSQGKSVSRARLQLAGVVDSIGGVQGEWEEVRLQGARSGACAQGAQDVRSEVERGDAGGFGSYR